jgi:hypothetical protein
MSPGGARDLRRAPAQRPHPGKIFGFLQMPGDAAQLPVAEAASAR